MVRPSKALSAGLKISDALTDIYNLIPNTAYEILLCISKIRFILRFPPPLYRFCYVYQIVACVSAISAQGLQNQECWPTWLNWTFYFCDFMKSLKYFRWSRWHSCMLFWFFFYIWDTITVVGGLRLDKPPEGPGTKCTTHRCNNSNNEL